MRYLIVALLSGALVFGVVQVRQYRELTYLIEHDDFAVWEWELTSTQA